jgi:hypothetical protein
LVLPGWSDLTVADVRRRSQDRPLFVSKYFAWNDVDVIPVVDVAESVAVTSASIAWARAASSS